MSDNRRCGKVTRKFDEHRSYSFAKIFRSYLIPSLSTNAVVVTDNRTVDWHDRGGYG